MKKNTTASNAKSFLTFRGIQFGAAVILLLIVSITALLLAVVNFFTAPKIAENNRQASITAIEELFPDSTEYTQLPAEGEEKGILQIWEVYGRESAVLGYCIFSTAKGFKSDILTAVAVAHADRSIIGVKVISQKETAGIGDKITDSAYLVSYAQKIAPVRLSSDVDAISGATISSKALNAAINTALTAKILAADNPAGPETTAAVADAAGAGDGVNTVNTVDTSEFTGPEITDPAQLPKETIAEGGEIIEP